ncbi:MAG: hypothetical protein QOI32_905 [Thermoleophilaceae bacterium]|nr:hypothetical protein [Thermoleophilaceae bacterium]
MTDACEAILRDIQSAVEARDPGALADLFDEQAVLVGTGGDARDRDAVIEYLTAVATQRESLRWDWHEVVPFHQGADTLGFAAFGEIVVSDGTAERRAPIRATLFAVDAGDGWRLRQFHGSIPSDF